MRRTLATLSLLFAVMISAPAQERLEFGRGTLILTPLSENTLRVQYTRGGNLNLPEWIYTGNKDVRYRSRVSRDGVLELSTKGFKAIAHPGLESLSIQDRQGRTVFTALDHQLKESKAGDLDVFEAGLEVFDNSGFQFGLGQFQDGYLNVSGLTRRLTQVNTQISLPMYISGSGYGLLWNNYGLTDFNPSEQFIRLERQEGSGKAETVNVTGTSGGRQEVRSGSIFTAELEVPEDGRYSVILDCGRKMSRRQKLAIDGEIVFNLNNLWLPPTCSAIVELKAGKHSIVAEMEKDDTPILGLRKVTDVTELRSPVAECVDYTVFVGDAGEITASFRELTGEIPLMPKWALGYIHCRERYHSSEEILQNAAEFRNRGIGVDMMVQGWQYWGDNGWNAMAFDKKHYPDPKALLDSLHAMDMRLMLSVWSKIDKSSELGKEMEQAGYYIPDTDWIDFFNPEAAATYWDNFSSRLLKPYGIDAWWQDATEPENDDLVGRRIWNGTLPGELLRNAYPLTVSRTVYEGLRRDDPQRRSMILTRSAFPGMQRYATATWSGDVGNDWNTLRTQINAGLGMMSAGQAWWTYDAGGFFRPRGQYGDKDYIERMLRWVECSVFLPLMRVHGYMSNTEPWRYGPEAERIIKDNIALRYSLMPYIYSWNARVSFDGSTLMRPLIFAFPQDTKALETDCEYMFGDALLVRPVTNSGEEIVECYLPENKGGWYDFHSGRHYEGGRAVKYAPGIERIPVFARAGSIIPMGKAVQYAAEDKSGYLDIRVYPGADAGFVLYEDAGDDYGYENGECSFIPMTWNDKRQCLEIGARKGSYEGLPETRTIKVTVNGKSLEAVYDGHRVKMKF